MPDLDLSFHLQKRECIDLLDALRSELESKIRRRKIELSDLERNVRLQTDELRKDLDDDFQFIRHRLAGFRTRLKHAAVVSLPIDWPNPQFNFAQRVLVSGQGSGTITGMDYSDGSVVDAGWSYLVVLDKLRSTGLEWSQIFHESELEILGTVPVPES